MKTSLDENKQEYTVYMHKNKINNKVYIGQTRTSVNNRWQDGKGYKGCTLFERAINKYGWDNFDHIIVASNLTKEESCQMEKDLIALYESTNPQKGYNLSTGGESGHTGVPMSKEARNKISIANKGKVISEETRKKMSIASSKYKISALAYIRAVEVHSIPVVQLTKNGLYIETYSSSAEASRKTGINESTINSCCNKDGKAKSAGGFMWMRKADYDNCAKDELCYKNNHIRPIVQLDKHGSYMAEFESSAAAAKILGLKYYKNINHCLIGDSKSAYGFVWIYKDEYDANKDYSYKRNPYGNQYAVIQMDKNNNVIAEFNSVQEAHRTTGVNYSCICECCNGTQQTAGGFIWKRKNSVEQK